MTEHKTPRRGSKTTAPRPGVTQLRVARLLKAHGLKGAIKLELYTDEPDRRFTPGATFTLQVPTSSPWHGKTLELTELRWYNGSPVAFFDGVADRTAAESLIKAILWIDKELAELPTEQDAWYDHQLVGLRALRDDVEIGRIARVEHLPAQDLLVIQTGDREVLVPFVGAIVPAVDIAAGTVTITPPPGLFEDLADEEPAPAADPVDAAELAAATASDAAEAQAASDDDLGPEPGAHHAG